MRTTTTIVPIANVIAAAIDATPKVAPTDNAIADFPLQSTVDVLSLGSGAGNVSTSSEKSSRVKENDSLFRSFSFSRLRLQTGKVYIKWLTLDWTDILGNG